MYLPNDGTLLKFVRVQLPFQCFDEIYRHDIIFKSGFIYQITQILQVEMLIIECLQKKIMIEFSIAKECTRYKMAEDMGSPLLIDFERCKRFVFSDSHFCFNSKK